MRAFLAGLFALLSLLATPAAAQQERILNFHGRAVIHEDGSATITEDIRVMVQGVEIRRGIFRDIPTRFQSQVGQNVKVGLDFLDASLDGAPVATKLSRLDGGVRIRIGSADVLVPHGIHTYRIRYRLKRAVGFHEQNDSFTYNVTGNGWGFPIDRAAATLVIPGTGAVEKTDWFTGDFGETGKAGRLLPSDDGEVRFETTRRLRPGEGFTVQVVMPKGLVTAPTEGEILARKVADWAPAVGAVVGLLLVVAYYWWAYFNIGRDPRPGTIVPLFAPPDNMSPAAIRYVTKQTMDHRGFAAALVDAAVRGFIRIEERGGGVFSSKKTEITRLAHPDLGSLSPAEYSMLNKLGEVGDTIEADNENHKKFSKARGTLDYFYKRDYDGVAFKRNLGWAFAGLLALFAALGLVAAGIVWSEDLISPIVPLLAVASLLITMLLFLAVPDKGTPGRKTILVLATAAAILSGALAIALLPIAVTGGGVPMIMLVLLPGFLIVLSGFFWMSAPTLQGRVLLDRIAGFKQYLSTTEGERFRRMQPPGENLKLFERYLPYAIALGVEHEWAEKFEDRLAAAANAPARDDGYFAWYSGSRNVWDNPTGFTKAMGSTLASTLGTAASAPSSGGGSGGGGFSGGGVGGGGGGGW